MVNMTTIQYIVIIKRKLTSNERTMKINVNFFGSNAKTNLSQINERILHKKSRYKIVFTFFQLELSGTINNV